MASRELKVEIIGDSRSLERALGKAGDSATGFGGKFAKAGKVIGLAALGMGAAVGAGLFVTLKRGFDELADSQKVMAQTGAVIKSTGGIANVTAKQVDELATSLSHMSGVDDEVIASGENMLLTFKNVRNEVGKGNDIFTQATGTLLDMSTALGTDMNKSAIQLGKALNDPIKGITALTRVGVTFTAGQKETIKGLVEGGKTMQAQKIILAELNSEFGGSAKAFGDTMPGQLAKLKNSFDEVAGELATKFLPIITSLVQWVNAHWPEISAVIGAVGTAIIATFKAIGATVNFLRAQWEIHRETVIATWKAVQAAVQQTVAWFQTNVVPPIRTIVTTVKVIWNEFGDEILRVLRTTFGTAITILRTYIQNFLAPFKIFLAVLRGDWSEAWNEIKATFTRTIGAILAILRGALTTWGAVAKALGLAVVHGVTAGLKGLAGAFVEEALKLLGAITSAAQTAYNFAKGIGVSIINGIVDGLAGLITAVKDKIVSGVSGAVDLAGKALPGSGPFMFTIHKIGEPMGEGVAIGFLRALQPAPFVKAIAGVGDAMRIGITRPVNDTTAAFGGFGRAKDDVIDNLGTLQSTALDTLAPLTTGILEPLREIRSAAVGGRQMIRELIGELKELDGKSASARVDIYQTTYAKTVFQGTEHPQAGGFPSFQHGGIFTGKEGLALLHGPEAIIPLNGRTRGIGGGTHITVNVHGSVTSERDLVTSIRNALVQEGRRSGGNLMGGYA